MFSLTLKDIFTLENLLNAFRLISQNSAGIDNKSYAAFQSDLNQNILTLQQSILNHTFIPEPFKRINIPKDDGKSRPISLGCVADKLVERTLYLPLCDYFDKFFSNKSYAYRPHKSTFNAINRTAEFIRNGKHYLIKADIQNFFESINHDKLFEILKRHIVDENILSLLELFVRNGIFQKQLYQTHQQGIHQGSILSPLLSNIYLNLFDSFLERNEIAFVRYADDFVLLFDSEDMALEFMPVLKQYLKILNLELNQEKSKILYINDGFKFLGVNFLGDTHFVSGEKIIKICEKFRQILTGQTLNNATTPLNQYLQTLKNYYFKLLNRTQISTIERSIINALSSTLYFDKKTSAIKNKKSALCALGQIRLDLIFSQERLNNIYKLILTKAQEQDLFTKHENFKSKHQQKSPVSITAKLAAKRDKYARKFAQDSTLHIFTPGIYLSISKNKIVAKHYGKTQKSMPLEKITRIIIEASISLSTALIKKCADKNITIDFIDANYQPYASLLTHKATMSPLRHKQAGIYGSARALEIAKEFIKGKAANQINYLKYLNKYHKILNEQIKQISAIKKKIQKANSQNELMGFEGSISALYWDAIKLVLDAPFDARITYGAKDLVNSALNYAYAILYGKIQQCLNQTGLSLEISFLHAPNGTKPTLSFDMIEEFRTFIVDRTIVSMLNKQEPLEIDKSGLLTERSRQLISQNIKEKLGQYTTWHGQSVLISDIISTQCYALARAISGQETYKAFIGKF